MYLSGFTYVISSAAVEFWMLTLWLFLQTRGYRKDGGGGKLYGKFSLIDLAGMVESISNEIITVTIIFITLIATTIISLILTVVAL